MADKTPLDHGVERFTAEVLELARSKPMDTSAANELDDMETALNRQRVAATIEHIGESDIGRLTSEAILSQYEVASKAIEGMGEEMKQVVKGLEAALVEADDALKSVTELAATIRENGKLHQVKIEQATQLVKEVRDACTEFTKKFGSNGT